MTINQIDISDLHPKPLLCYRHFSSADIVAVLSSLGVPMTNDVALITEPSANAVTPMLLTALINQ